MRILAIHLGLNSWHVTLELLKRMEFFKQTGKPLTSGGLGNPHYYRVICFGPFVIRWYRDEDLERDADERARYD